MPVTTSERLRIARAEAGLSQPQLSELTGIAQANLSRYERGQLNPNGATVDKIMAAIAKHLGRPIESIGALDGAMGILGRTDGKLVPVDVMGKPKPVAWLADHFLARRFVTMIAGQAGAGKSSVTQTLVTAMAQGEQEVMGMTLPGKPLRSLIIDAENVMVTDPDDEPDASLVQERLQQYGLDAEHADNITCAGMFGFDLWKDRAALDALLTDYDKQGQPFDVLVIDSFTSVWFGNENQVDQVRDVLTFLNRMAVKHNLAILLIHHTDKSGDTYRGSSAIAATIAAVFTFSRIDDDDEEGQGVPSARVLRAVKVRIAAEPKPRFLFVTGHGVDVVPADDDE